MDITLRQATSADRQFVLDTYVQAVRGIEQLFIECGDSYEAVIFDDFYYEEFTRVILVDDKEAGFLSLIPRRTHTNIQCFFLRPEYRGRGIGTHLLQEIIAEAVATGTRLTIGTERINPAKRLYERLGFVVVYEWRHRVELAYGMPKSPHEVASLRSP